MAKPKQSKVSIEIVKTPDGVFPAKITTSGKERNSEPIPIQQANEIIRKMGMVQQSKEKTQGYTKYLYS